MELISVTIKTVVYGEVKTMASNDVTFYHANIVYIRTTIIDSK